jgi:acetylornithine deacetylase/succinyl-diaminopimelate desuccinylase-like protein
VRAKSPNPPGDTRLAAAHVTRFLEASGLPFRVIAPEPSMPNIVGSFDTGKPGHHLVLNGHMDVFPADVAAEGWTRDPWGGAIVDGKIYGRGVADMKAGTSASIFTYYYLHRVREHLKGKLTLTTVSDEETFGPWGARYLMEHHPEVHGDCCLNGEPSSPLTVRFGEKGPLWLKFTLRTKGAHGAYTHLSPSATKNAARLIVDLEELTTLRPSVPIDIADALAGAAAAIDEAQGPGAKDIVQRVTLNIGVIHGGVKVNIVPGTCWFEADIRVPPGLAKRDGARQAGHPGEDPRHPEALSRGHVRGVQPQRPERLRPKPRDDRHPSRERQGARPPGPGADREPRRHGCTSVAPARNPGARARTVSARHGAGGRARGGRGVPTRGAHARAVVVRLSVRVSGTLSSRRAGVARA